MRCSPAAFAACCLAVVPVVAVSVRPVAGQVPAIDVERHPLNEGASKPMGTRFIALRTSAPGEMWNLVGAARLTGPREADLRGSGAVQLVSGRTVRSKTRTAIGGALMTLGGLVAYWGYFSCEVGGADAARYTAKYEDDRCVLDPSPNWSHDVFAEHTPDYGIVAGGAAAMGLGLLLSTVWADVDVKPGQNGVEVAVSVRSR